MPIIEGVGDELVYAVLVAAPLIFMCGSSLRQLLKQGVYVVRRWLGGVWSVLKGEQASNLVQGASTNSCLPHMEAPPDNDCCSVCHDSFILPCQANCAHWFCGECILRVWQHSSALQPCKCPICRRAITLLIPTELSELQQQEPEVERIMSDLAKYNRIFGGGAVNFLQAISDLNATIPALMFADDFPGLGDTPSNLQELIDCAKTFFDQWRLEAIVSKSLPTDIGVRVRDMPLLLRRMVWELMDPQRAIPLVHRTRILFFLVLLAIYVFSPLDVVPEGMLGVVGLLDDVLVIVMVLFYLAMLYRSTLILHHGGHTQ